MSVFTRFKGSSQPKAAIEEIQRLAREMSNGHYSDRANVTMATGEARELLLAVNALLDAGLLPVRALTQNVRHMLTEHDSGDIDVVVPVAQFKGDLATFANDVNNLVAGHIAVKKKAMACVKALGEGNFEAPLEQFPGKKAFINETIETLRANLKGLIAEMNRMSDEHDRGDIDVFVPVEKFNGDFATMAKGVNTMVAGHIAVKKKAIACIKEFGDGNFDSALEQFPGKKAFINEAIEAVRANLKGLIAEMNRMSDEHDRGDIDVFVSVEKFNGDFATMAKGVNTMVAGHIAVKKKAMACIKEFGEGNFDASLEQFPGKKAFINDTVEAMRANLRITAGLADQIADGNLTVQPKPMSDKDTLGIALERMVERLRGVVSDATSASEHVSAGSQELSAASEQVSQGATEQASSAEEASASMEEMAANIKQNADNAAQTEKIARQSAKSTLRASGQAVNKRCQRHAARSPRRSASCRRSPARPTFWP